MQLNQLYVHKFLVSVLVIFALFLPDVLAVRRVKKTRLRAADVLRRGVKSNFVVCIAIPKCGTHLLAKCLSLLGESSLVSNYTELTVTEKIRKYLKKMNRFPPPHNFMGRLYVPEAGSLPSLVTAKIKTSKTRVVWTHFSYTPAFYTFLKMQSSVQFLMVRDPRAMLVSLAHMLCKGLEEGQSIALEPLILDLIDGRQKNYIPWGIEIHEAYPIIWKLGISAYYKQFLAFMHVPTCLTVRFEDLVGAQGGGLKDVQMNVIKTIAAHVGVGLDDANVANVIETLFGGSATFREGKIDSWKKYFTPAVKCAFKKAPGAQQLLVDLGYEKDDTW